MLHFTANVRTGHIGISSWALDCSVLMVFAAIVAWQFGGLPTETLAQMRIATWGSRFALASLRISVGATFSWSPSSFLL